MDQNDASISDESFDRYARLVRASLGVPTALVSIVEANRQIFPGASGLPQPWQDARETPLTHSFCQHVVAEQRPLIISDARLDPRVVDNLAITDLQVIAYAGYPLTDVRGQVVGALCAIDSRPREWTPDQLLVLADLAAACSSELMVRETRRRAEEAELAATTLSRHTQGLLSLSEGLANTRDVADVALAVEVAARESLDVQHAGVWVYSEVERVYAYARHPKLDWPQAERRARLTADDEGPVATAARDNDMLVFRGTTDRLARFPASAAQNDEAPIAAAAYVPLQASGRSLGTLALAWSEARRFSQLDRALLRALGSYAAQALERAQLHQHRADVAVSLQRAMLTHLPEPDHLELRVRYIPAAVGDLVGGDWYDAVELPDEALLVTVGDVSGHDLRAATEMGQLRNILRAVAWNNPDDPSAIVRRTDDTAAGLRAGILATMIIARIEYADPESHSGPHRLRWTNAGHLPPILISADGRARALRAATSNVMIGVARDAPRDDHSVELEPGSTLLLYTDGLIETRDRDIDQNVERLLESASAHHELPLDNLIDALVNDLVPGVPEDDIALLAVRFHPEDRPRPVEAGPSTD